jgi:hypothetical protein
VELKKPLSTRVVAGTSGHSLTSSKRSDNYGMQRSSEVSLRVVICCTFSKATVLMLVVTIDGLPDGWSGSVVG